MTLRADQADVIARVQAEYRAPGVTSVCLQSSTGWGKTHAAAEGVIAPSLSRGRRVLFLADLEEIVLDTVDRLKRLDVPAASILKGRASDPTAPAQVASQQTLVSWLKRGVELPPADRVILDECHGAAARTTRELLTVLRGRGALLLGLTATPSRGDSLPLDEFDRLVCGPQPRALVSSGALVPVEVLAPPGLQQGVAMDPVDAVLTGPARGRRAVIFAPHAQEATRIAAALTDGGQPSMAVLDSTATKHRRAVRGCLESGELRHLVTVRALQKGFDAPLLNCAILTSAGTVTSYLQSVGRVLRPSRGKSDALVLDLRGAAYVHGLPLDDRTWSLSGQQGQSQDGRPNLRRCKDCHSVFPVARRCPRCGSFSLSDPRPLRVQRAELVAQSGIPVGVRARRYVEGVERCMVARGMQPHVASRVAREKAPQWVKEALRAA